MGVGQVCPREVDMATKAQTRFEFWDGIANACIRADGHADATPEHIAKSAAKVADQLLKARDDRAAFLLQRKPGEIEAKAAKAKAAAKEADKAAAAAKAAGGDDEDEDEE